MHQSIADFCKKLPELNEPPDDIFQGWPMALLEVNVISPPVSRACEACAVVLLEAVAHQRARPAVLLPRGQRWNGWGSVRAAAAGGG